MSAQKANLSMMRLKRNCWLAWLEQSWVRYGPAQAFSTLCPLTRPARNEADDADRLIERGLMDASQRPMVQSLAGMESYCQLSQLGFNCCQSYKLS